LSQLAVTGAEPGAAVKAVFLAAFARYGSRRIAAELDGRKASEVCLVAA